MTDSLFILHPRLAADGPFIADLPLCRVLLMNNTRFPWLVLVPRREEMREVFDLTAADRTVLMEEIAQAAQALQRATAGEKMNIAALGNQVPQFHVHVIARFAADDAWPNPVWSLIAP